MRVLFRWSVWVTWAPFRSCINHIQACVFSRLVTAENGFVFCSELFSLGDITAWCQETACWANLLSSFSGGGRRWLIYLSLIDARPLLLDSATAFLFKSLFRLPCVHARTCTHAQVCLWRPGWQTQKPVQMAGFWVCGKNSERLFAGKQARLPTFTVYIN